MKKNKVFENDFMRLEMKDGIVFGTYKKSPITLEMAKQVVQNRLEFTAHQDVPILISDTGIKGIEREARQYLSSEEGVKGISAAALIMKGAFSSHLINFFMKISAFKQKMPAKSFTNEEEAVKWLKQFIK